ncbi:MAG: hypothetical protein NVSMB16_15680 [Acidimicrobiales bacterium]
MLQSLPESQFTRTEDGAESNLVGDLSSTRRQVRGHLLIPAVAAVAAGRLGLRSISDNSTLVHLRTGLGILAHGAVPHRDPYSFTAPGHPWVVQSWLASVVYALADRAGNHALVLEQGFIFAVVGILIALCARSVTGPRWALGATLAVAASAPGWSPRPLMFGLACLALTILVVERRAHPAWLVPIVWVWVNTHGSFPLGLAWLGARTVGEAIDRRGWPRRALPRLAMFVGGMAVALVNPVGYRLLSFPLVALHKRSTFQGIVEWHSPNFQTPNHFLTLVFVVASLVVLLRCRVPWAQLVPVCGFLALGLVAARNLGPFGVVLAPALASALSSASRVGALAERGGRWGPRAEWLLARSWLRGGSALAVATVGAVFVIGALGRPALDLGSYPVGAVDEAARTGRLGAEHRIAATDVVGCYLLWRAGPATKVFIDDRYDMYPTRVALDAGTIGAARDDASVVLDRYGVDTVIWSTSQALPMQLRALGGWREQWRDAHWALLVRGPAP